MSPTPTPYDPDREAASPSDPSAPGPGGGAAPPGPQSPAPPRGPAGPDRRTRGSNPERLAALLSLLEDPHPGTWRAVRDELTPQLAQVEHRLRAAARGGDARARARARTLLGRLEDHRALRRLHRAISAPKFELEPALWRLSRLADPRFDARPFRARLDRYADRVRELYAGRPQGNTRNIALSEVLGGELGLRGPDDDYHHPDRIFLHRALESGRGMPLTLTAIYLAVARRAGLQATAVPLPGHVLLRLKGIGGSLLVDPFHSGAIRTKKDCQEFLRQHGLEPRDAWFADAPERNLFGRHLLNLSRSLSQRGRAHTAGDLADLSRRLASTPRPPNR